MSINDHLTTARLADLVDGQPITEAEAQRIVIRRTEHPPLVTIRTSYSVELVLPFTRKRITLTPIVEVRQ